MTDKTRTVTGLASATVVTLGILTSIFIGNRYDLENNVVQTNLADDYTTVLIFKGDDPLKGEIVYIDQDDDTFDENEEFYLKNGIKPGKYTMLLGNEDTFSLKREFYIDENSSAVVN